MKTFLTLFVLFFSSSVFGNEWNFQYLKEINDGCLKTAVENASIGEAFEYCGCSTHRFYEDFTVNEIIEIYSSGNFVFFQSNLINHIDDLDIYLL